MKGKLFKPYYQNQLMLLPPNIEELIPAGHVVRFLNEIIDKMNIGSIIEEYKGGGAPSYAPRMMIKILVYAYLENIYGCRRIAKAVRENINFMWLGAMQKPDFKTINNFRSGKLKGTIKDVFKQVVEFAAKMGLIKFENIFVDGTKMEANSNKHKIVWRKNVERYKAGVEKKIDDLFDEIDRINEEEDRKYGDKDLPEIDEDRSIDRRKLIEGKIKDTAERINRELAKKKNKLLKEMTKLQERKSNYEQQELILNKRNSYSKTDPDASAMMMKNTDEIRPGYNLMLGTENQIIVNYEIEQNASDGACFIKLIEGTNKLYSKKFKSSIGDQAFGTEENFNYCEREGIIPYLKFGSFHREKSRKFKENPFIKENFAYDKIKDVYICPSGKELKFQHEERKTTATGYKNKLKIYSCEDCGCCQLKSECCPNGKARHVQINKKLEKYKSRARELLNSEEGIKLRKRRGFEVETPFGDMKQNRKMRRFSLRSKLKVKIDAGLAAIAYNIRKIKAKLEEKMKSTLDIMQNFLLKISISCFYG